MINIVYDDAPMPEGRALKSMSRKICEALKNKPVGFCIKVEHVNSHNLTNLSTYAKNYGIKIKRERVDNDTYRFWLAARLNNAPAPVKPVLEPSNTPKAAVESPPQAPSPAPLDDDYVDEPIYSRHKPAPAAAPELGKPAAPASPAPVETPPKLDPDTQYWSTFKPDAEFDDGYDDHDSMTAQPITEAELDAGVKIMTMLELKRGEWVDPTPLMEFDGDTAQSIVNHLVKHRGVESNNDWGDFKLKLPASGGDEYPPHIIELSGKILDMIRLDNKGVTVQRMMKELGSNSNDIEDALDVIYKRIDRMSDTIYFVG